MDIILLIVGFSLIVLIHEFGHFIAAKYVGIKVEQFALGFGPAIFSWRKGLGFRMGSTEKEYNQRIKQGADPASMSETEYRWNWVPLGGYVKMLGQDDTKPGLVVEDPRSYTSKSVGARMLVISAGVIMNIIFAGIAFMVLFMVGLDVPRAVVGGVTPMSPAQFAQRADGTLAPLEVGDQILSINGTPQHDDFRKIALNAALAKQGEPMELEVKRLSGEVETVRIIPQQLGMGASIRLLGIGVSAPVVLEGLDLPTKREQEEFASLPDHLKVIRRGDRITAVNGEPVSREDYPKLYAALQASNGDPVMLTVTNVDGSVREEKIVPRLVEPAVPAGMNFAGMLPRVVIDSIADASDLYGKAKPGDVVLSVASAGDVMHDPSYAVFRERVSKAGEQGIPIDLELLRNGEVITLTGVQASVRLPGGKGLGVGLRPEIGMPVVAGTVQDSSAYSIPAGSIIKSVNGVEVANWNHVLRELKKVEPGRDVTIVAANSSGIEETHVFQLKESDSTVLHSLRYSADLLLKQWMDSRTTNNPLVAAGWGVLETRDSILQVYLTISRLVEGSVPFSGMMGPVGMFAVGTQVASQGIEYLLWFLAIISANLAVVNFLPVPVVDGGHFMFLLIEKIQGKPISERTMVVAQYIGLAMILSLFVAVTYQDILRLITY